MTCKIGARVEIAGKDCQGYIAYIGYPGFASGKWIGVILDEPKGKNNGAIKGQVYFKVKFPITVEIESQKYLFFSQLIHNSHPILISEYVNLFFFILVSRKLWYVCSSKSVNYS